VEGGRLDKTSPRGNLCPSPERIPQKKKNDVLSEHGGQFNHSYNGGQGVSRFNWGNTEWKGELREGVYVGLGGPGSQGGPLGLGVWGYGSEKKTTVL